LGKVSKTAFYASGETLSGKNCFLIMHTSKSFWEIAQEKSEIGHKNSSRVFKTASQLSMRKIVENQILEKFTFFKPLTEFQRKVFGWVFEIAFFVSREKF